MVDLLRRQVAVHALKRLGIQHGDGHAGAVKNPAAELFARAQGGLGLLALGQFLAGGFERLTQAPEGLVLKQ